MIKVSVNEENNFIKEIKIDGHANFDDYGRDIVCAAVSSIVTTTVNAILRLDKDSIYYDDKVNIRVLKGNDVIYTLLDNMLDLLKELEHDYPKNIKFL
ncbi:MAG: ribosomal-processing cysteine protease Prp [bacterium]|nr:ribosomal-processing cysteine protease Prp [bacterium]